MAEGRRQGAVICCGGGREGGKVICCVGGCSAVWVGERKGDLLCGSEGGWVICCVGRRDEITVNGSKCASGK